VRQQHPEILAKRIDVLSPRMIPYHFSAVSGGVSTSDIGPSAAGFAFDLNHSYTLPIVASIVAYVIAAVILAHASRPYAPAL
jgi:hypothetical protein